MSSDLGDVWEEDLYGSAQASKRRAWRFAYLGMLFGALGFSSALVMFYKEKLVPVVVTVDKQTGYSEIGSRLGTVTLDQDEAVTTGYIYRYVRDRETYDTGDNFKRIEQVYQESAEQAADSLYSIWGDQNSTGHPINVYGEDGKIFVKIRSIAFIDSDTASIRLRKIVRDNGNRAVRDYVATLDFEYARGVERPLEELFKNPLGFQVTSYRIDAETFSDEDDREVSDAS